MKTNSLFGKTGLFIMMFATLIFAASCANHNTKKATVKKIDQESVSSKTAAVHEEAQDTVMFKKKLQFFKDFDLNKDKKISQKEYMSMASAKFEQMDKNHDGKLTAKEYDLVSTIAPKGQNFVTKPEFLAHYKSKFQTMDKNKDGYVTMEELDVREN
jgi:Ca2+-binding EF-hand superfamily protein